MVDLGEYHHCQDQVGNPSGADRTRGRGGFVVVVDVVVVVDDVA